MKDDGEMGDRVTPGKTGVDIFSNSGFPLARERPNLELR